MVLIIECKVQQFPFGDIDTGCTVSRSDGAYYDGRRTSKTPRERNLIVELEAENPFFAGQVPVVVVEYVYEEIVAFEARIRRPFAFDGDTENLEG